MALHEAFGANLLRDVIDARRAPQPAPEQIGIDLSDYPVLDTGPEGPVYLADDGMKYGPPARRERPRGSTPMPLRGLVETPQLWGQLRGQEGRA